MIILTASDYKCEEEDGTIISGKCAVRADAKKTFKEVKQFFQNSFGKQADFRQSNIAKASEWNYPRWEMIWKIACSQVNCSSQFAIINEIFRLTRQRPCMGSAELPTDRENVCLEERETLCEIRDMRSIECKTSTV